MEVYTLSNEQKPTYWESLKEAISQAFGQKPNKVEGQLAARTEYYKWVLINKLKGLFEIECPELWDTDYFLEVLLLEGKIAITDTTAGVLPLRCAAHGINAFERSTDLTIANPVLGTFDRRIDENAVLMYLFDNRHFMSFLPTVMLYAQKLASCDSAIEVNLINTKVAYVFDCVDKKQADEAKLIYDKITAGEPAVFYHSTSGMNIQDKMQFFGNNVKNVYVADLVQAEKRDIYNEFLTQVGINNAAQEKKERLLVDEVNSNNDELQINMNYCYANIKKAVKKANAMFPGLNLSVKLPFIDKLEEISTAERQAKGEVKKDEPDRPDGDMGTEK